MHTCHPGLRTACVNRAAATAKHWKGGELKIAEDGVHFPYSLAYSWAMSSIVFHAFRTGTSGKNVY